LGAGGTLTLTSAAGTDNQTVCSGTAITNIAYTYGGTATGITVTGLPAGLTSSTVGNVLTITGTPTAGGTYTVTAATPCGPITLSGTIQNANTIAPTFAAIGPFCQGSAAVALPLTSTNNIGGSWSPATISTAAIGTTNYTFTPTGGQCGIPIVVKITISGPVSTTSQLSICPNQIPYNWNGQQISVSGTYTANLTNQAGCDSTATLIVTVTPTITSTTNTTICANQLPYAWNGQSITESGTYSSTFTNTGGCDSIAVLNLTVNSVLSSTTNITVCTGQLPYSWNGQSYNAAGTYNVTLTSAANCDSVATLNLSVTAPTTSTTNLTVCPSQIPYTWNGQSLSVAGTYTATITNASGCDSIATLNFAINSQLTSTTNLTVCPNQLPYSWNGQSLRGAGTYTANLTAIGGCDSTATLNLTVSNILTSTTNVTVCSATLPYSWNGQSLAAAGSYTSNLTSAGGCDSVATLVLTVDSNYLPIRYPAVTATPNVATQLYARVFGSGDTYSWSPNIGLDQYNIYNPVFNYDQQTQYLITITSPAGCSTVDTLLVQVNNATPMVSAIFVPLAWSPNGDGHNDRLYPLTENIKTLHYFRIFNRWGQLMFETNAIGYGWDGNYKGKPQISDVYTWTAEAIGYDGHLYQKAGNSLLLR
ncbi:MAG TPA: T9SS type B sorting domain-containing protein, partial [Puia sp.]|nr:T9SS type B sorting domain-containing protein [Puia sp.]